MENKIRVSCSNLVRLELDGKIVLLRNRHKAEKGIMVYTPIGGVVKAYPQGIEYIEGTLEGKYDDFYKKKGDLRFHLPEGNWDKFEKWFFGYQDRESVLEAAYRETHGELVREEKVLPTFPDPNQLNLEVLLFAEEKKVTDKPGSEGQMTRRLYEVVRMSLPERQADLVRANLQDERSPLLLASEEMIQQEAKPKGLIRDNCLALTLNPDNAPYREIEVAGQPIRIYLNK